MGKSRYSKQKSTGFLCGCTRHKKKFENRGHGVVNADNRQMRREKERVK